jgi:hypothetical protein
VDSPGRSTLPNNGRPAQNDRPACQGGAIAQQQDGVMINAKQSANSARFPIPCEMPIWRPLCCGREAGASAANAAALVPRDSVRPPLSFFLFPTKEVKHESL